MPRLVVAMPAYNSEATIRSAVVTTLRAMPKDSELLVFNDNSSDATLSVLDTVRDSRLRVISSTENVGGGGARRRMLEESDSEYIAAMDSDDIAFPWRFAVQMKALETNDAVFSSALRFGSRGYPRPSTPLTLRAEEFPAALLFHNPVWHPSLVARRSAIYAAGGYGTARYAQDYELWLRMACTGARMHRLGIPVIAYRESPKQVTKSSDYITKVSQHHGLRKAYLRLYCSRAGLEETRIADDSEEVPFKSVVAGLEEQLRYFKPINRLNYTYLLRSNRSRAWLTRIFPG